MLFVDLENSEEAMIKTLHGRTTIKKICDIPHAWQIAVNFFSYMTSLQGYDRILWIDISELACVGAAWIITWIYVHYIENREINYI